MEEIYDAHVCPFWPFSVCQLAGDSLPAAHQQANVLGTSTQQAANSVAEWNWAGSGS